jgi:hypothetical protein
LGLFCQASSDKAKSEGLSQLEECTFWVDQGDEWAMQKAEYATASSH